MAIQKAKKIEQVEEISRLLADSKLTVAASYSGVPVKAMQDLRRQARDNGTVIKVVKNRLFHRAMLGDERFKGSEEALAGQLLYAFNSEDEVAPAQVLASFAKSGQSLTFVSGFTADGKQIDDADLQALADLPSKEQLRAQTVGIIAAPLSGLVSCLSGNLRGTLQVLRARADQMNAN